MTGWNGTPGPWRAGTFALYGPGDRKLAHFGPITTLVTSESTRQSEANAKGAAAVPAMVEAMLLLRDHVDYRNGACRLNELVGAVLPTVVLDKLDAALRLAGALDCPGHVASAADPKVCGHCGTHVDEYRDDGENTP